MTELDYRKALEFFSKKGAADRLPPVLLIFGEPYLREQVIDAVIKCMFPDGAAQGMCVEVIDPSRGDEIADAIEHLSTFSLLSGKKVVLLKNASLFSPRIDMDEMLAKIQASYEKNEIKAAARMFCTILSARKLSIEDVAPPDTAKAIGMDPGKYPNITCLEEIAQYCINENMAPRKGPSRTEGILNLVEKGFAPGNYLVVSEESADRRTSVFKHIESAGIVIDCSVPAGNLKADRDAQRKVLHDLAAKRLGRARRRMNPTAFHRCLEITGYNIPLFLANIDKLIDYVGNRPEITPKDVDDVLVRTRKDPIYEFTGAIAEKKMDAALIYLYSLLDQGYHHLQIFKAIVNHMRRLYLLRGFIDSGYNKNWSCGISYDYFKKTVFPDIAAYDNELKNNAERLYGPSPGGVNEKQWKQSILKACSDLVIAKNPKNAYPIYRQLISAGRFSGPELEQIMILLARTDIRLKKSGQNPVAVIESLIFAICRPYKTMSSDED